MNLEGSVDHYSLAAFSSKAVILRIWPAHEADLIVRHSRACGYGFFPVGVISKRADAAPTPLS